MSENQQIYSLLEKNYPNAKYYLDFTTPLELLVAAILSTQTKDEIINAVTPDLFAKYKTPTDYAQANLQDLTMMIKRVSFSSKKAGYIKDSCQILIQEHQGSVPESLEKLSALPGVGRKTANAILINAFDKVCGIVVDSHVIRVTQRIGWTKYYDADKIEQDLIKIFPQHQWKRFTWLVKNHGKAICKPKADCSQCFLKQLCQTGKGQ